MTNLENIFLMRCMALGLPEPEQEYRFDKERKWRFDFAWPKKKIAVEIEGGTWSRGRHNRPGGYAADCEKYNAGVVMGWRIFRYTRDMLNNGKATASLMEQIEPLISGGIK